MIQQEKPASKENVNSFLAHQPSPHNYILYTLIENLVFQV